MIKGYARMKCFSLFYGILFSVLCVCDGFAGVENAKDFISAWGASKWNTCLGHSIPADACIGTTANNCQYVPKINANEDGFSEWNAYVHARDNFSDEAAIRMMVAWDINAHGAKFCPVQIESANKNKGGSTWTEYRLLPGECVWLCKAGYTGDGCATEVTDELSVEMCDPTPFRRDNYKDVKRVSGSNLEDSVRMFAANNYVACWGNVDQEHDIILAVVGWLDSGHGAKVKQMTVRADRSGYKNMISWAVVYPAGGATEFLVCKSGYKPNAGGTDCVEINAEACKRASVCTGGSWNYYNASEHTYKERKDTSGNFECYEYRCSDESKAFRDGGHECVDCSSSRRGPHPSTGICTECPIGKAFDKTTGNCNDAKAYSKTDLQYGLGKTNNSVSADEERCWEKLQHDDYVGCVTGKCPGGTKFWTEDGDCKEN